MGAAKQSRQEADGEIIGYGRNLNAGVPRGKQGVVGGGGEIIERSALVAGRGSCWRLTVLCYCFVAVIATQGGCQREGERGREEGRIREEEGRGVLLL